MWMSISLDAQVSVAPAALATNPTIICQTVVVPATLGITARKEPCIPSSVLRGATRESSAALLKRAALYAVRGATSPLRAVQTARRARWDASPKSRRRAAPRAPRVATAPTLPSVQAASSDVLKGASTRSWVKTRATRASLAAWARRARLSKPRAIALARPAHRARSTRWKGKRGAPSAQLASIRPSKVPPHVRSALLGTFARRARRRRGHASRAATRMRPT
mmetsp:Transcript_59564/g.157008  ORF Transcript_59564/g.157008 Transcript_59564/m.157008 type:complete len:222 (+) Transcript_59564:290-955(+)